MSLYSESFGHGPDLVMVHGWAMHSGIWRDFALTLAKDFRVTLIDLPGHGHSPLQADLTLDGFVAALLPHTPERAYWLGWSLGASLVLRLAQRHPERVAKLVMIAGNARFAQSPDWPSAMASKLLQRFADNLEQDYNATLARFLNLQTLNAPQARTDLRMLKQRLGECPEPRAEALHAGVAILQHADLRPALTHVTCPIQLILGACDALVPVEAGAAMAALAPQLKVTSLPHAAHLPFLSHPVETTAILRNFLLFTS